MTSLLVKLYILLTLSSKFNLLSASIFNSLSLYFLSILLINQEKSSPLFVAQSIFHLIFHQEFNSNIFLLGYFF